MSLPLAKHISITEQNSMLLYFINIQINLYVLLYVEKIKGDSCAYRVHTRRITKQIISGEVEKYVFFV